MLNKHCMPNLFAENADMRLLSVSIRRKNVNVKRNTTEKRKRNCAHAKTDKTG